MGNHSQIFICGKMQRKESNSNGIWIPKNLVDYYNELAQKADAYYHEIDKKYPKPGNCIVVDKSKWLK